MPSPAPTTGISRRTISGQIEPLGHEEKIKDFGWRAISETTLVSKRIIQRLKSQTAAKSYFVGCSDGGREALMMAQRFPRYFDGIVAGAPAGPMTRLFAGGEGAVGDLDSVEGHLRPRSWRICRPSFSSPADTAPATSRIPVNAGPDLISLKCTGTETDSCLTDAQIKTVAVIYQEQKDPVKGAALYGVLPGAEGIKGSWDVWLTGTDEGEKPAALGYTWNYFANMVMRDPHLDVTKVTDEDIARGELHYAPILDAVDPNLAELAHGGKLIQYHGWNDPGIAPGYSLEYRARVAATMGKTDDFYRLYMVPGMLHCGGDAPTNVDWQAAIEAWVEKGAAPGALVASDTNGGAQTLLPFRSWMPASERNR